MMDLTTNLIDIWPKYENSDRTPKFGDRVTLAKGRFGATGELAQIAFHVSESAEGSDSLALELFAGVDDEDWGKTTLRNPTFYLEEEES